MHQSINTLTFSESDLSFSLLFDSFRNLSKSTESMALYAPSSPCRIIIIKKGWRGLAYGLAQPIPAGIFPKPAVASRNTQAVNTNGPVRAGSPHCPKNHCRAGIRNEQPIVAKTAIINDWGVRGTK